MDSTQVATTINSLPTYVFAPLTPALCDFAPHIRVEALAQAAGQPFEHVYEQLSDRQFVHACERGELNLDAMLSEVRTRLDADLTEAHMQGLWALAYEPDLGAIESLRERFGPALAVLLPDGPLLKVGLGAYLPEVFRIGALASLGSRQALAHTCDFGYTGSEPQLYNAIARACDKQAESFGLVDCRQDFSKAALAAGWQTIQA